MTDSSDIAIERPQSHKEREGERGVFRHLMTKTGNTIAVAKY